MEHIPEIALAIVVPEADPFVQSLREKYDPQAANSIPAHITINYPFQPQVKTESYLFKRLSAIFSTFQSFEFTLNDIGRFPGVLYLKPSPDDPFHHLVNTIVQEFPESPPYGGMHKDLIPHLTVAHSEFIEDYLIAVDEIERNLEQLLPIHSTASRVSYLEDINGAWNERITFDLSTS